jgi:ubiquinone/menaquinone biosynthesis C-methylase UbiE
VAQKVNEYEDWWESNIVSGKYYTINQFKTILGNSDSRRAYLKIVKNGWRVLDVGCGLGLDYKYYRDNDIEVDYTGIDVCKGFIEYCRDNYPEGRFEVQPSYEIACGDKEFDIATARHLLEHLKEPYSTMQEMCRVANIVAIIFFMPPGDEEKIRLTRKGFYKNRYSAQLLEDYAVGLGKSVTITDVPIEGSKKHQLWVLR